MYLQEKNCISSLAHAEIWDAVLWSTPPPQVAGKDVLSGCEIIQNTVWNGLQRFSNILIYKIISKYFAINNLMFSLPASVVYLIQISWQTTVQEEC